MADPLRTIESSPPNASLRRVVIGTAGHIDHGKSTLVKHLTGIDPDRLPEEKARGLTIDLGFASLLLEDGTRVGIVDVPGHERFVHNMVAGATGVDLALLVVACDDGVMPQTVEHVEILGLLGLTHGAVALTKTDLVDADDRARVASEVRAALAGTFLERAPLFPVSCATGEGLSSLAAGLEALVKACPARPHSGPFRMPIQRVFTVRGFGCVLTGIPVSGSLAPGDPIEILPVGAAGIARGLEAYHRPVPRVFAGHSSAVNVSQVDAGLIKRGMVAVTPRTFLPVRCFEAKVRHLPRRARALEHRARLRLHCGTLEASCALALLEGDSLAPGAEALAQIWTQEPVVVAAGDRFLLRIPSPPETVAGGIVISSHDRRLRRRSAEVIERLTAFASAVGSLERRAILEIRHRHPDPVKAETLVSILHASRSEVGEVLRSLEASRQVVRLSSGAYVDAESFGSDARGGCAFLERYFASHPERLVCDRATLREELRRDGPLLEALVSELARAGDYAEEPGGGLRSVKSTSDLSGPEAVLREKVLTRIRSARFQPPSKEKLALECGVGAPALDRVLRRLVDEQRLARISAEFYFASEHVEAVKAVITRQCSERPTAGGAAEVDLPRLRDELGTTRRWLIPLVEWLDASGFTTRLGNRRILRRRP